MNFLHLKITASPESRKYVYLYLFSLISKLYHLIYISLGTGVSTFSFFQLYLLNILYWALLKNAYETSFNYCYTPIRTP